MIIFRQFETSPQTIRFAVMTYVRYPLSLRNVEELLVKELPRKRGIDIGQEGEVLESFITKRQERKPH